MAAPAQKPQFALDTNVLIDLGERLPFAHTFRGAYADRGLSVSPTVVQELTNIAFSKSHEASNYAFEALANMREWNIYPFDLKAVGHGIAEADAQTLIRLKLLPDDELNDGLILIETALACIPCLVTSDHHLLQIDRATLIKVLGDLDLIAVQIVHPKDLLRAVAPPGF